MNQDEFQALAHSMGATVVFKTSATAVFSGPRYVVTVEAKDIDKHRPVETADVLASISFMVDKYD